MAWHAAQAQVVVFGGRLESGLQGDSWHLRLRGPTPDEVCGHGFDADGDGLVGCADPDCDVACARCGNGLCDPTETCRLCPTDCGACTPLCGDGLCDPAESCVTCPGDCC